MSMSPKWYWMANRVLIVIIIVNLLVIWWLRS